MTTVSTDDKNREGVCKDVPEKTEWVATAGTDGPHAVATWGDDVRALGIGDDQLLIPNRLHEQD